MSGPKVTLVNPTGFGVGTAAAREYEHAGIGPLQRFPNL